MHRKAEALRRTLERTRDLDDPALNARSISPSDEEDLRSPTRGLYLGKMGTVKVILWDDDDPVQFVNMVPGVVHPLAVKRVLETGTDPDLSLVGLF